MSPPALRPHQLEATAFARSRPASLIAAGMGCGKTAVALALADEWETNRTLVLCPTTVRPVWRGQIAKHAAREYNVVILDSGSVKRRTKRADWEFHDVGKPAIIVVNYEAAWREPFRSWVLSQRWDLTILDESQRAQRESRTALFCNELRKVSDRRLCLSGTPLTQDPVSVWAQCRFLDPSVFGEDLEAFKWQFEDPYTVGALKAVARLNKVWLRSHSKPWVFGDWLKVGTINTEEYLWRLSTVAFRVENAVLNLPPLTVERRTFRLSDSARSIYEAIQEGYLDKIESGRWPNVKGSYAITMRLQQITSGWLPDRDGKIVPVDGGKAHCLEDILVEAGGEPVVVFARFVRDLDTVESLAAQFRLRYGEISQRRKDGLSDTGTMPEGLQVVGVQEQAGGAGIDLTLARLVVRYSPSWSVDKFDQSLARVYRPPQTRPVIVYELVAEDSVDEEVYWALTARRQVIGQVWSGLAAADQPSPAPASDHPPPSPIAAGIVRYRLRLIPTPLLCKLLAQP